MFDLQGQAWRRGMKVSHAGRAYRLTQTANDRWHVTPWSRREGDYERFIDVNLWSGVEQESATRDGGSILQLVQFYWIHANHLRGEAAREEGFDNIDAAVRRACELLEAQPTPEMEAEKEAWRQQRREREEALLAERRAERRAELQADRWKATKPAHLGGTDAGA